MYILDYIGKTPLIRIYDGDKVKIYAKLENMNPSGSIKDRTAWFMIKNAEMQGKLKRGVEIIEPSSGNTGISLAMLGALRGYKTTIVMPKYVSKERSKIISSYGGRVIYVNDNDWRWGAIEMVKGMVESNPNAIFLNQYNNKANIEAHYKTTGLEIVTKLKSVDFFIAGIGTGGTLIGVAKRLKEVNPKTIVIGVEPKEGEKIQGLRRVEDGATEIFLKHKHLVDNIIEVSEEEAKETMKQLHTMGYFVGESSGAVFWVAKQMARYFKGNIVTIFPDSGDRYIF